MRLGRQTDLSLRLLMYLAASPDRAGTIAGVAERYDVSKAHMMKVAHLLGREGFIRTRRGRGDGLELVAPPERISASAVVRATEEDFALVECQRNDGRCLIASCRRLETMLTRATEAFLAYLDGCTLADLTNENSAHASLLAEVS